MKFPMSECPLSFCQGCELAAKANVQHQSWPEMALRGGAHPALEAVCWLDTLYLLWDIAPGSTELNWGGEGGGEGTCKGTYLVRCCPIFSKMLNLKTIRACKAENMKTAFYYLLELDLPALETSLSVAYAQGHTLKHEYAELL